MLFRSIVGQDIKELAGVIAQGTVVTGIGSTSITLSKPTINSVKFTDVPLSFGSYNISVISEALQVGYGVTQSLAGKTNAGIGTTSVLDGYLKGIITGVNDSSIDIKVTSYVDGNGTETPVDYQESGIFAFSNSGNVAIHSESSYLGISSYTSQDDWYDEQTLGLENSTIYWKSIAPKPITSRYSLERSGKNDSLHVVVIDDVGSVTGIQGNLLEKHLFLSKASDAVSAENSPLRIFWKEYLALYSFFVYAGRNPSEVGDGFSAASGFSDMFEPISNGNGLWNLPAQGVTYSVIGNTSYNLTGGANYESTDGYGANLSNLITSYNLFLNEDEIQVDYLIMGPGLGNKEDSQIGRAHV